MPVRYVDPHKRRGRLYRTFANVTGTQRWSAWFSRNLMWKLDPVLLRVSGGRLRSTMAVPSGLLETTGARTGEPRRNAVIYFHDGDRIMLIASKFGASEHPAWFHNARANPDVAFGGQPFRAEVVEDEAERRRLWELADRVFPPFAVYRERAARVGRVIPILRLVPKSTPAARSSK